MSIIERRRMLAIGLYCATTILTLAALAGVFFRFALVFFLVAIYSLP
jgi:hypothetical protein